MYNGFIIHLIMSVLTDFIISYTGVIYRIK